VWLLLFKSLALAPIGIFSGTDLDHISNYQLEHGSDTCDEEDYANPPMPYVCCQHAFQRSRKEAGEGILRRSVGSIYVVAKALHEALGKAFGELIARGFDPDGLAKFGVEFKCPLTIGAYLEMAHHYFSFVLGQFGIDEAL
jgi:hypothetical protein